MASGLIDESDLSLDVFRLDDCLCTFDGAYGCAASCTALEGTAIGSACSFFCVGVVGSLAFFDPNFRLTIVPCGDGDGVGYGRSFRAFHILVLCEESEGLRMVGVVLKESFRVATSVGVMTAVGDGAWELELDDFSNALIL